MKKNRGILASMAAVLLISTASWASLSQDLLVTSIEIDDEAGPGAGTTTSTYLSFSALPSSATVCKVRSQFVIDGTPEHVRNVTSVATAALLAGKKVEVAFLDSCFSASGTTYSKIANIKMLQ